MKKLIDFLILLAPCLLWFLANFLLGDEFSMPNRLILAILCTAVGAAALLTQRKLPGITAIVGGLTMLALVPIGHEVPDANFDLRLQTVDENTADPDWMEKLGTNSADLLSVKNQNSQLAEYKQSIAHPFSYQSCQAKGPILFARYPIQNIFEAERMGTTQIKGELTNGDTCISFALLDLSTAHSKAETIAVLKEFLSAKDQAGIAVIDTGKASPKFPSAWLNMVEGYTQSKERSFAFQGNFGFQANLPQHLFLHTTQLHCTQLENDKSLAQFSMEI